MTVNSIAVGIANTKLRNLDTMGRLLKRMGIRSAVRRTNKKGGAMTVHGRTWIRRHDVYHLVVRGFAQVSAFRIRAGFAIPEKAEKLRDLTRLESMLPRTRYDWFVSHHAKRGRKWVKIREGV